VLGGIASLVTIITFLNANNGTSGTQSNDASNVTTPVAAASSATSTYPVNIQTNFLNSCEVNGSQQVCQCDLTWFEQHISLTRFEQDDAEESEGITSPDVVAAADTCG